MNLLELFLIAVGLSMDAFAVAACFGLTMNKVTAKKSAIIGSYFGSFQAIMPLIGYLLATQFSDKIVAFDHLEGYHKSAEGKHPKRDRIEKRITGCLQCGSMTRDLRKKR